MVVLGRGGKETSGERHYQAALSGHSAAGFTGAPEERLARARSVLSGNVEARNSLDTQEDDVERRKRNGTQRPCSPFFPTHLSRSTVSSRLSWETHI